jgi:hypothetical protein
MKWHRIKSKHIKPHLIKSHRTESKHVKPNDLKSARSKLNQITLDQKNQIKLNKLQCTITPTNAESKGTTWNQHESNNIELNPNQTKSNNVG